MIFSPKEEDHVLLNRLYTELSMRPDEDRSAEIRGLICQVDERFSATRIRNYTTAGNLITTHLIQLRLVK